jgi:hypothetical protein
MAAKKKHLINPNPKYKQLNIYNHIEEKTNKTQ